MTDLVHSEISKTRLRFVVTAVLLLIAMIGLSVIWNRSIKEELANQATSFIRKSLLATEMRDTVEFLNGTQLSSFEMVLVQRSNDSHIIVLPPMMDLKERLKDPLRPIFYGTVKTKIFLDSDAKEQIATLVFSYSRFELFWYALSAWAVFAISLWLLFHQSIAKIQIEVKKELRIKNADLIEEMATKIRHNIRSPLAVLKALFEDGAVDLNAFMEQAEQAVLRIEEIVSDIRSEAETGENRRKKNQRVLHEITNVVDKIIDEKKLISKDIQIQFEKAISAAPVFSDIPPADLKATLSNLIDNSLQAINGFGSVSVKFEASEFLTSIEIRDTGCGIAEDNLRKVFERGFSYGKEGGSGLGLYFAKQLIEEHQGNIEIQSQIDEGTTITLNFQRLKTPVWFLDRLDLSAVDEVVVCDDQATIHKAWQYRFKTLPKPPRAICYSSCEEMASGAKREPSNRLLLLDFDLGKDKQNGLDFVQSLEDRSNIVLVTGHFDDPEVQASCLNLGIKLMGKDEISRIALT